MAEDDAKKTPSARARPAQGTRAKGQPSGRAAAKADAPASDGGTESRASPGAASKGLAGGRPLPVGLLAALAVVAALAALFVVWPGARERVAALFSAPGGELQGPTLAERLDMLEVKLRRLEDALATLRAAPAPDLGPFEKRLAALEERMGQVADPAASLRGIEGRLESVEGRIATLTGRLEETATARTGTGTLALMALANALREGTPFTPYSAPARAALMGAGGAADGAALAARLDALAAYAETGVPEAGGLLARFTEIPREGEAKPEPEAAAPSGSFWERIRARIRGLVVIRRVEDAGAPGTGPAPETGGAAADLGTALAALEGAPGPEAAAWRRDARARIEADRLARDLDRVIAARLAGAP